MNSIRYHVDSGQSTSQAIPRSICVIKYRKRCANLNFSKQYIPMIGSEIGIGLLQQLQTLLRGLFGKYPTYGNISVLGFTIVE